MKTLKNLFIGIPILLSLACGAHPQNSAIDVIGGQLVAPEQFPSALAFEDTKCAAVKVAENFILTAAHCVVMSQISAEIEPRFRAGEMVYFNQGFDRVWLNQGSSKIVATHLHPDWAAMLQSFEVDLDMSAAEAETLKLSSADLALIEVEGKVSGSTVAIQAKSLQEKDQVVVIGAGCTMPRGPADGKLRHVDLQVERLEPAHIIAVSDDPQAGKSSCGGDSGGPVLRIEDGLQVLVGINSFAGRHPDRPNEMISLMNRLDTSSVQSWLQGFLP